MTRVLRRAAFAAVGILLLGAALAALALLWAAALGLALALFAYAWFSARFRRRPPAAAPASPGAIDAEATFRE